MERRGRWKNRIARGERGEKWGREGSGSSTHIIWFFNGKKRKEEKRAIPMQGRGSNISIFPRCMRGVPTRKKGVLFFLHTSAKKGGGNKRRRREGRKGRRT